jgi:N-acyl amino acid synthase of PEP-CTERM/exosortase system
VHAASATEHFRFVKIDGASDDETLSTIFALRYEVYCNDRKFLPAEDYPDHLETDDFDRFSTHFCAIDKHSRVAAAVRLVRAPDELPFQRVFGSSFRERYPVYPAAAEISRLVVDRNYHRRSADLPEGISLAEPIDGAAPVVERRAKKPELVLGLYRAMYQHSLRAGIAYWYAAMERGLARALLKYHIEFQCIGPEADYFGPVAPYLASLRELEMRVGKADSDLLRWFMLGDDRFDPC